jgi:hypothetical protein
MNKSRILTTILLCCIASFCFAESQKPAGKSSSHRQPEGVQDLKSGDPAPDFKLM